RGAAVGPRGAAGPVRATRARPPLPVGAPSAFAAADVFAPEVLGAVATVQVIAEQPLAGSLIAGGAAATDVALTTAPPRAGTALGLPLFVRGEVALDTAVRVFNPGTSAVTVSMEALDAGGRVLRDGSRSDSVPVLGSLALAGPWPTDATWLRIVADQPVVAQATVSSAAGGIATIPAVGEEDGGPGYALDGTE